MNSFTVASQVLTLGLIAVVGIIASKKGIISPQINKKLSEILLQVTSPALIFNSFLFEYSREKMVNALYVAGFSVLMFVISILLSMVLFIRNDQVSRPVMKAAAVFSNCGYFGFPILDSILGKEGLFYGSIYVVVFNIFFWTYGVVVFSGEKPYKSLLKALRSPSLIAVYIGAAVFMLQIKVPQALADACSMLGSMTMPLAMLIIGAIIAESDIKKAFNGFSAYYSSLVRLILMPLITVGLAWLLPIPQDAARICILVLAMPVAVNVAIFAEKYEKDAVLASKCVIVSTVVSMLTLPALAFLLF